MTKFLTRQTFLRLFPVVVQDIALLATATPKSIKRKKECLQLTPPPEGGSNPAIASVVVILKLNRKQKTEKQTRSILILT